MNPRGEALGTSTSEGGGLPPAHGARPAPPAATGDPIALRFGVFELDLRTDELRRAGVRTRLQQQPARALALLALRVGQALRRILEHLRSGGDPGSRLHMLHATLGAREATLRGLQQAADATPPSPAGVRGQLPAARLRTCGAALSRAAATPGACARRRGGALRTAMPVSDCRPVRTLAGLALASALAGNAAAQPGGPVDAPATAPARAEDAYADEIARWRAEREERLRSEDGWLTLAGLYWLRPGRNRVGSAAGNDVRLPASAPAQAAVIEFHDGRATYQLTSGATGATLDGRPAPPRGELRSDAEGAPTRLAFGAVSFFVIRRGERFGVRVKDRDADTRRDFAGLQWYPVDPGLRVRARLVPHAERRSVRIPNVLGQVEAMQSPGEVLFTLEGRELRLTPVVESPEAGELFLIFRDATAGEETYPAGRFLYAPLPEDGVVTLDFNKAHSPPCAFTPYATCPLPPPENRLEVPIAAGEKWSGRH